MKERDLPLTINLNTATVSELTTIRGLNAGAVVRARNAGGYFTRIEDLRGVARVTDEMLAKLHVMEQQMRAAPAHERQ